MIAAPIPHMSAMSPQPRVQPGVPAGGQFSSRERSDASVVLASPSERERAAVDEVRRLRFAGAPGEQVEDARVAAEAAWRARIEADAELLDAFGEFLDFPPTTAEVDAARRAYHDSVDRGRPMHREDWERINGGSGPTVAQHRAYTAGRSERSDRAGSLRRVYERTQIAWEVSDKTQDARLVACTGTTGWTRTVARHVACERRAHPVVTTSEQPRVSAGVLAGGEFAKRQRPESEVHFAAPRAGAMIGSMALADTRLSARAAKTGAKKIGARG